MNLLCKVQKRILISGNKTFWRILKPFFKKKDFDSNTYSDFNSIH